MTSANKQYKCSIDGHPHSSLYTRISSKTNTTLSDHDIKLSNKRNVDIPYKHQQQNDMPKHNTKNITYSASTQTQPNIYSGGNRTHAVPDL
jgi:hypothetical protein